MKIQGKETKYNIGDIVIMAWVDCDPELAVITGINLRYDDDDLDGDMCHILTYRTTRLMGGNNEQYEGPAGAFLCKITDAEAVKKYAPEIREAFANHGFKEKEEDDGEEGDE